MLYSRQTIEEYPLQVYYSALLFAPEESLVREQYCYLFDSLSWKAHHTEKVWKKERLALRGHERTVHQIAFAPGNPNLVVSAGYDRKISVWDVNVGTELLVIREGASIRGLAVTPNGIIVSATDVHTVIRERLGPTREEVRIGPFFHLINLWDLATGRKLRKLELKYAYTENNYVSAVAVSKQNTLASGFHCGTLAVWNLNRITAPNGQILDKSESNGASHGFSTPHHLWDFNDHLRSICYSDDSRWLAVGLRDVVHILNSATGDLIYSLSSAHHNVTENTARAIDIASMMFCPTDPTNLALGGSRGAILVRLESTHHSIIQLTSGRCVVAFSPDGTLIAVMMSSWHLRVL